MKPKVSIVIPTYKRDGKFLSRAIDSVLGQTYPNIEVIVVDDNIPGSDFRKETEFTMEKYKKNKKIFYVKNKSNMGGALARNQGIYKAKGEFLTFLDDDDIYLPLKVERQLFYMLENDYDLTFTDLFIKNTKDKLIDVREFSNINKFSNNSLLKYHIMRHITGTPTFMFKKEALVKIGAFTHSQVGQEFFLMLKAIEGDLKIGYLRGSDVIAYVHNGEKISSGKNKLNGEKYLYEFKQTYFDRFNFREKMFIRFRHHVVMAVTGLRSKIPSILIKHSFLAVFTSPVDSILEPLNHIKRIFVHRFFGTDKKIKINKKVGI